MALGASLDVRAGAVPRFSTPPTPQVRRNAPAPASQPPHVPFPASPPLDRSKAPPRRLRELGRSRRHRFLPPHHYTSPYQCHNACASFDACAGAFSAPRRQPERSHERRLRRSESEHQCIYFSRDITCARVNDLQNCWRESRRESLHGRT